MVRLHVGSLLVDKANGLDLAVQSERAKVVEKIPRVVEDRECTGIYKSV